MRRPRILTLLDSLRSDGCARSVVSQQGRISRRSFDLRVAVLAGSGPLAERLKEMQVPVYAMGLSGRSGVLLGVPRLRRFMDASGIDLLHTVGGAAGVVGRLAAWRRLPVVSTLADPSPTGGRDRASEGELPRLPALDRFTARRIPKVLLAASPGAAREHARRGWPAAEVMRECIDVHELRARVERHGAQARTSLGLSRDETVFLYVGRFRTPAIHGRLLRGFRVALTERPDLRLLVAGEGPALPAARGLAEELALGDAVVFLGAASDLTRLYAVADVFVVPSEAESGGTRLLETLAAGLPALVDRSAASEDLADKTTAVLADAAREEELARGMLSLAGDAGLRRRLGEAGRKRAANFDVLRSVARLERIYTDLLDSA